MLLQLASERDIPSAHSRGRLPVVAESEQTVTTSPAYTYIAWPITPNQTHLNSSWTAARMEWYSSILVFGYS